MASLFALLWRARMIRHANAASHMPSDMAGEHDTPTPVFVRPRGRAPTSESGVREHTLRSRCSSRTTRTRTKIEHTQMTIKAAFFGRIRLHYEEPEVPVLKVADHACTFVMLRKLMTLNVSAKWRHQLEALSSPNYKSVGDEPPSPLQCAAARPPMMVLLLGVIEAPHEASSQLARASEVTWK